MVTFNQQGYIYPASFFPGYIYMKNRYNKMTTMEVPTGVRAAPASRGRRDQTILFLGEFQSPEGYLTRRADAPIRRMVREAAAVVINLEAPLCLPNSRCTPIQSPLFPAFAMTIQQFQSILKAYGIPPTKCIVNLANNHPYDLGAKSLTRTTEILHRLGCRVIGTRDHPSVTVKGVRIMGCTARMNPPTYEHADTLIQPDDVPLHDGIPTIVYVHWGWEYYDEPDDQTVALSEYWCRGQTNILGVVGHGPHLLQRMRTIQGRPVFYSLGDTVSREVFNAGNPRSLSGALQLSVQNKRLSGYAMHPILQSTRLADTPDSLRRFRAYYH
jgi:hypothetical protein